MSCKAMRDLVFVSVLLALLGTCPCQLNLPHAWSPLGVTMADRIDENNLTDVEADGLITFLREMEKPAPKLQKLQHPMPKTTLELVRFVHAGDLDLAKAEQIATKLNLSADKLNGRHLQNFDNQTAERAIKNWRELA